MNKVLRLFTCFLITGSILISDGFFDVYAESQSEETETEVTETEIKEFNVEEFRTSMQEGFQLLYTRYMSETSPVKIANHRGFQNAAPENTMPAFELSAKKGLKYIECDIHFTSDNVCVVLHDNTINRTARNADGSELAEEVNIHYITYEEAMSYDYGIWKGPEFTGTKLPTFDEFMAFCSEHNIYPWVELKSNIPYTEEQYQIIADTIQKYDWQDKTTFISFHCDYLDAISNLIPQAPLGYNCHSRAAQAIYEADTYLKNDINEVFLIENKNVKANELAILENCNYPLCFYVINTVDQLISIPTDKFTSVLSNSMVPSEMDEGLKIRNAN